MVFPDTSPRFEPFPETLKAGESAGFYLTATAAPFKDHFNMFGYIKDELHEFVCSYLPVDGTRRSVMGHSMGGHGALMMLLKAPGCFKSVSCIAPVAHPTTSELASQLYKQYLSDP
jgi:S-formylglutathione hydrolase